MSMMNNISVALGLGFALFVGSAYQHALGVRTLLAQSQVLQAIGWDSAFVNVEAKKLASARFITVFSKQN